MDASWIIPAFGVIDTPMNRPGRRRDGRAPGSDSAMTMIRDRRDAHANAGFDLKAPWAARIARLWMPMNERSRHPFSLSHGSGMMIGESLRRSIPTLIGTRRR